MHTGGYLQDCLHRYFVRKQTNKAFPRNLWNYFCIVWSSTSETCHFWKLPETHEFPSSTAKSRRDAPQFPYRRRDKGKEVGCVLAARPEPQEITRDTNKSYGSAQLSTLQLLFRACSSSLLNCGPKHFFAIPFLLA